MKRIVLVSLAALMSAGCTTALAQTLRPSSPYADFLIGSYAERARDPVAAAERFAAALRTSPRDPRLLEGAADAALLSGDVAAAARYGAQARASVNPSGRLAMAALALKQGRNGEVARLTEDMEGAPAEQLSGRLLEVWAMAGQRKTDGAIALLGDVQNAPRSPWAALQHYERAMVLHLAGRNADALTAYAAGDATAGLRIAQIVLLHGQLLESEGRKDDARALYTRLLADVDNPGVREALARLDRGAAPARMLTAPKGAAISLFAVAVLVGQDPRSSEQLAPLALAMALDPEFEGARLAFSDAMRALGRESPYFDSAQSQIAFSLREDGRTDEAVATLKAAVADGNSRTARRALADLYRGAERYAEAEPLYAGLVAELGEPAARDWRLFFVQGATLERLGRWPEAEAALQKALKASPDQPEVLNYLGYQWVDSGRRVQDGLAILERAAIQRPQEGYIIDSLGWAYYRLGQYQRAVDVLERAVELSPGDPELNDHLGDAYWRVGRRIEARFQWRRALTLEPNATIKASAERKLADGLPATATNTPAP
jgi:tetratricopeptide (TPR) repeat protein